MTWPGPRRRNDALAAAESISLIDLAEIFAADGILAERLGGYSHRPQQQAMAEAVERAMAERHTLVCEAGTGTGKTFAYLVPAVLSGRKVIISTGTKNLQDQLFHRDLPLVRDALSLPIKLALLKGRGNYLCLHRLQRALDEGTRGRFDLLRDLSRVREWASTTRSGDVSEAGLPEGSAVWPLVTSTTDNCLGQECPTFDDCHLVEARRRAQSAELVVVNHHLLCADLALKDEGFGEVLPGGDAFVIDEAHQLPEVASQFFGQTLSSRQLTELAREVEAAYREEAGDMPDLLERNNALIRAAADLRVALGDQERRAPWDELAGNAEAQTALASLNEVLDALCQGLDAAEGRGKRLDACNERARLLGGRLAGLAGDKVGDEVIRWIEVMARGFRLNETPLDVAGVFRQARQGYDSAWIFTSATLAVRDSFDHFLRQVGVDQAETACWDSPFDYPNQALWFVPRGLPEPSSPDYTNAAAELMVRLVEISRGRAFLLFTSHRALNEATRVLSERVDYPLLVQGTAPRAELVKRFSEHGNAVLLGASSFWEGVDVRGPALSCVVVDKLPFASPGDPVLSARIEAMRSHGGNPFRDHQLPQAVIALKQGAGRLIRDEDDRGLFVVCDPRMLRKSYGHAFLDSLPPMARTRRIEDVEAFFAAERDESA